LLILIEGADNTGKTTLASTLAHAASLDYVHQGPPYNTHTVLHHLKFVGRLLEAGTGIVMDRGHWSDLAYGPKYHPENWLGEDGFRLVDDAYRQLGGVAIHAEIPLDDIRRLHADLEEDYLEMDDIERLVSVMRVACFKSEMPTFHHDFVNAPVDTAEVLRLAKELSVK
jgi:cytidylate kinase